MSKILIKETKISFIGISKWIDNLNDKIKNIEKRNAVRIEKKIKYQTLIRYLIVAVEEN